MQPGLPMWIAAGLFACVGCTDDRGDPAHGPAALPDTSVSEGAAQADVDLDADVAASSDSSVSDEDAAQADTDLDARVPSSIPICILRVAAAKNISELTCGVPLTSGKSGPIYRSVEMYGGGVVSRLELCDSSPLAWYPDDPDNPTKLLACSAACARVQRLFPAFVAAIRPFSDCDDPSAPRFFCTLSQEHYRYVSELSCVISVTQTQAKDVIYEALRIRGANVVSSHDLCASDPLAWYPDNPDNPTRVTACEAACTLSSDFFPSLVASTKPLLGCDAEAPVQAHDAASEQTETQ